MYCTVCGAKNPDSSKFCESCGAQINSGAENTSSFSQPGSKPNTPRPALESHDLVLCIVLSIITCGIYGIIWMIRLVNELNAASEDTGAMSGGMVFLLGIITCSIYTYIWSYQAGARVAKMQERYGLPVSNDNSLIYLLLSIFGLHIVTISLIQNELNKAAQVK